jgi:hypothetical protein
MGLRVNQEQKYMLEAPMKEIGKFPALSQV